MCKYVNKGNEVSETCGGKGAGTHKALYISSSGAL